MKSLEPTENSVQIAVIDWIKLQHPWLIGHTIHIANQRKTSIAMHSLLKNMGLLKGASDLFIAWPTSKYYGLFIEIKTKRGRVTEKQKEFLERMTNVGYFAVVAYGCDEVIYFIKNYLANKL
jgi:hypothetical protein